ncbi:HAD family hydrolase [Lacisediminihabitans sp. FW035]
MAQHGKVMVFDFDGTVSLGDGPVRSYARFVAAGLGRPQRAEFLARLEAGLAEDTPGDLDPLDGYDLVRMLSTPFAVTDAAHSRAYASSRAELASAAAPVMAPFGLAGFLTAARPLARLVLATNAPETRIAEALDSLGLAGVFDEVHTAVGKPAGLDALLDGLLAGSTIEDPASALLSIGDVWINDLEPAYRRGATTALVGPRVDAAATPTLRAVALEELYPRLSAWLESPHRTTSTASSTLETKVEK